MKKAPKKALSLVTTCAMALSLANPLLIVAAENSSKNASAVVEQAASRATSSKCNLDSLSVDKYTLSPAFNPDVSDYTIEEGTYNSLTIKHMLKPMVQQLELLILMLMGLKRKLHQ
ncbi:MAG: hypothetical protein V8S33_00660 [Intestinibacter bartlettii]